VAARIARAHRYGKYLGTAGQFNVRLESFLTEPSVGTTSSSGRCYSVCRPSDEGLEASAQA
jgi:hypothetical protein